MKRMNWRKLLEKESVPVALISFLIVLAILIGLFVLLSNKPTLTNQTVDSPTSFAIQIEPIQKGANNTETNLPSNADSFFMSGYKFELTNDWKHTKNILGLKDTTFVSNFVEFDATTSTNGDAAQVFYINKGDYTFYISNQFITDTNLFYNDGINYAELVNPEFTPDGLYLAYSSAGIVNGSDREFIIRKQIFSCPYNLNNVCFASGYLPLTAADNPNAVEAFKDFINSIKIYDQN